MRRDKFWSTLLLQWFSSVGPVEGMCHCGVVIGHELSELRFEVTYRSEVSAPQALSMNNTEHDLNLIEPRAVFRKVDKTDSVTWVREEFLSSEHGFQNAVTAFFPKLSTSPHCSATHVTKLSEACVLRQSTTKIHSPSASVFIVFAMC